jgi:glycosyltransferase involved in cell wall biosynthesis
MNSEPLVSIIVPVYKVEKYVARCIESILAQTYNNWELLLIDDGSPDLSGNICDEFSKRNKCVRTYHKSNGGVSSARNFGIEKATGDWIMFIDADDWIENDCIERCFKEVQLYGLDFLQFGFYSVKDPTLVNRSFPETKVLDSNSYVMSKSINVTVWACLFNMSIINKNHIRFDTKLKLAEDQIFVFNYLRHSNRVKYLSLPLYYYFDNTSGAVHNAKSEDMEKSSLALINISKEWAVLSVLTEHTILYFIIMLISNEDISDDNIKLLYEKSSLSSNACHNRIEQLFFYASKINFRFSLTLLRCLFIFKKYH